MTTAGHNQESKRSAQRTINNILTHDYKLGIIRYAENYDKYFKAMLEEKGLITKHKTFVVTKDGKAWNGNRKPGEPGGSPFVFPFCFDGLKRETGAARRNKT